MTSVTHGKKRDLSCTSFVEKVLAAADLYSDYPAVSDDRHTFTYAELLDHAKAVAEQLKQKGLKTGEIVPVICPRDVSSVVSILGISMAGGCFCPLDSDKLSARTASIIRTIKPRFLIANGVSLEILDLTDDIEILNDISPVNLNKLSILPDKKDLAYVIFTSGSTGQPKGVIVRHDSAANALDSIDDFHDIQHKDCFVQNLSFGFDPSLWTTFWPLWHGSHLIIASSEALKNPEELASLYDQHRVRFIQSSPPLLKLLLSVEKFKKP